jgi:sodium transport system permease protein
MLMRNILNIVKKELDKIFKSPRLIISTFLLPAILIFVMYSFMGNSAKSQVNKTFEKEYNVVLINESQVLENALGNLYYDENKKFNIITENKKLNITDITYDGDLYKEISTSLRNEETDMWIFVDSNFDQVATKQQTGSTNLVIYTHINNTFSSSLKTYVETYFNQLSELINVKLYDMNIQNIDVSTEKEKSSTTLALMAPMLIMTFIFAGALSIGADSIAGEKERGTISTMLMAPISKNQIVLGKILSAIIITVIASVCSFVGLMASLNNFSAALGEAGSLSLNLDFVTGCKLLVIVLLISLIAVSLFLVASTFAKSTKEATMYAMPVYILGIVSGVFTMYDMSMPTELYSYIIPIYNLTLGLKGIFINNLSALNFSLIVGSNIIYFMIILFIVKKMFNSEKIMLSR